MPASFSPAFLAIELHHPAERPSRSPFWSFVRSRPSLRLAGRRRYRYSCDMIAFMLITVPYYTHLASGPTTLPPASGIHSQTNCVFLSLPARQCNGSDVRPGWLSPPRCSGRGLCRGLWRALKSVLHNVFFDCNDLGAVPACSYEDLSHRRLAPRPRPPRLRQGLDTTPSSTGLRFG